MYPSVLKCISKFLTFLQLSFNEIKEIWDEWMDFKRSRNRTLGVITLREGKRSVSNICHLEYVCVCVCVLYHGLIYRVGGFIWKNTRRQTGNDLHHPELLSHVQHVVIDVHIIPLKTRSPYNQYTVQSFNTDISNLVT